MPSREARGERAGARGGSDQIGGHRHPRLRPDAAGRNPARPAGAHRPHFPECPRGRHAVSAPALEVEAIRSEGIDILVYGLMLLVVILRAPQGLIGLIFRNALAGGTR